MGREVFVSSNLRTYINHGDALSGLALGSEAQVARVSTGGVVGLVVRLAKATVAIVAGETLRWGASLGV